MFILQQNYLYKLIQFSSDVSNLSYTSKKNPNLQDKDLLHSDLTLALNHSKELILVCIHEDSSCSCQ